MANEKMTQRGFYEMVIGYGEEIFPVDGIDFAKAKLAKMDEDNEKRRKGPSKQKDLTELEVNAIEVIADYLSKADESVKAGAIKDYLVEQNVIAVEGKELTAPKVTALLKRMVNDGQVERVDKGKSKPYEYALIAQEVKEVEEIQEEQV